MATTRPSETAMTGAFRRRPAEDPRRHTSSWGVGRQLAVPRLQPPPLALAIGLALLALVFPLVGPLTWVFAQEQLDRVARGFAARRGVGWLVFAKGCGMVASYCVLGAIAMLIVILL